MKQILHWPTVAVTLAILLIGLSFDLKNKDFLSSPNAEAVGGHVAGHVLGNLLGASQIGDPRSVAYDAVNQRLFVVDFGGNRVLVFDDSDGITDGEQAVNVLGQPDFDSNASATTATGMWSPVEISYDSSSQRLFVAEFDNNRVLVFDLSGGITNGMAASFELGQTDANANLDFFDDAIGGNVSASAMTFPGGLFYDSAGQRLFVSDTGNARVLVFDLSGGITNGMAASFVLGQDSLDGGTTGTSATRMIGPRGLSYDSSGQLLFVTDPSNNRVLVFDLSGGITNGMAASFELGQTDANANLDFFDDAVGGTSASAMNSPISLTFNLANHRLFVSDQNNARVLVFDLTGGINNGMPASFELGQTDDNANLDFFDDAVAGNTATQLTSPLGLTYEPAGQRLFVADQSNARVLVFNLSGGITNGMAASNVLGQAAFDSSAARFSGVSDSVFDPIGQRLFVTDTGNSRILVFNASDGFTDGEPAVNVIGQPDFNSQLQITSSTGISGPTGLAYDQVLHRLYVSDTGHSRVLVFDLSGGITNGMAASFELGQTDDDVVNGDFFDDSANGTSDSRISGPAGLSLDAVGQRLFVSDASNTRVLVFDLSGGITNGMAASVVLGQANFTDALPATSATGMMYPSGLTYDVAGQRLFVADNGNNRVTVFDLSGIISNGMAATFELGQTDDNANLDFFDDAALATTAVSMFAPRGVSYDSLLHRLFVADYGNNRVLVFDLSGGITNGMAATDVYGQDDFTTPNAGTSNSRFDGPLGIFVDSSSSSLFEADSSNNRIMIFGDFSVTPTPTSTLTPTATPTRGSSGGGGGFLITPTPSVSTVPTTTISPRFSVRPSHSIGPIAGVSLLPTPAGSSATVSPTAVPGTSGGKPLMTARGVAVTVWWLFLLLLMYLLYILSKRRRKGRMT